MLRVSHTTKEKPGQEGGVSPLSPRVCNQGLGCGAAREPVPWGKGSVGLVLPDSVLRSLFLSVSLCGFSMSVPLAICSSLLCVSPTDTLLGLMTVFGSVFRAWPIPAVPQILGGRGMRKRVEHTRTDSEAEGQTRAKRGPWGQGLGRQDWPGSYSLSSPEDKARAGRSGVHPFPLCWLLAPLLLPAPAGMCEHFYCS